MVIDLCGDVPASYFGSIGVSLVATYPASSDNVGIGIGFLGAGTGGDLPDPLVEVPKFIGDGILGKRLIQNLASVFISVRFSKLQSDVGSGSIKIPDRATMLFSLGGWKGGLVGWLWWGVEAGVEADMELIMMMLFRRTWSSSSSRC